MDEIEKIEYSLNISRYVSTAMPEEIIDIAQVHKELSEIESTITKAKKHPQWVSKRTWVVRVAITQLIFLNCDGHQEKILFNCR